MPRKTKTSPVRGRDYHLSLSGCGFLGLYHVGVISAFHEYARHLCVNKIAGASAGSLAAACLLCDVAFGEATTSILRLAVQARRRALGPFHPGFDINALLYDIFLRILPDNAHELCSGRLHVSLTRVSDGANVLLNQFSSKEELVNCLMCSCFIPFYSGLVPPKVNGVAYMDGGFSDNLPLLDENTITVSPFSGENDICPEDESFNFMLINLSNTSIAVSPANLYRMVRILFPPHPEILARMTQQGFDDAVKYLQRHNLISCTRCLAVKSTFDITMIQNDENSNHGKDLKAAKSGDVSARENLNNAVPGITHPYDGCDDCEERKRKAESAPLPEPIREPMLAAAENENRGVINWLFKHRPVKVLSLLTLPYVLPFDITMSVASKAIKLIPQMRRELTTSLFNVLAKLREIAVPEETCVVDSKKWRRLSKPSSPAAPAGGVGTGVAAAAAAATASMLSQTPPPPAAPSQRPVSPLTPPLSSIPSAVGAAAAAAVGPATVVPAPGSAYAAANAAAAAALRGATMAPDTFSCQLAITEFNYSLDAGRPGKMRSRSMEDLQIARTAAAMASAGVAGPISAAATGLSKRRLQRKSYAGVPYEKRILSELSLGSKLSLSQTLSRKRKTSVMDALRSLERGVPSVSSAIELTNDMLDHERGSLQRAQAQSLEQILDVTQKKEALMAFYYTDDNSMNVTEIFDVSENRDIPPSTSPERPVNESHRRRRKMPVY